MSEAGLLFLAKAEGKYKDGHVLYKDEAGYWTIGYGHKIGKTLSRADKKLYGNGLTETEAVNLLKSDVAKFEKTVNDALSMSVSQNQFDALVSLAFNIGPANFNSSSVLKMINNPNASTSYSSVESAFKAWNKVTENGVKRVSDGLVNRRGYDWDLYSKSTYKFWQGA